MKHLAIMFIFSLAGTSIALAQFTAGQSFVSGAFDLTATSFKSDPQNESSDYYGYNAFASLGTFTKENKAVGWGFQHSLVINRIPYLDPQPRLLRNIGFGADRFVEFYQPIISQLSVYLRPSVGLFYSLQNQYNPNNTNLVDQTRRHTLSLGADLSAGLAWQFAPKWALYGSFAFFNPIQVSAGVSSSKDYRSQIPDSRGWGFNYQLSPSLSSGSINLGFRYIYDKK
jgi:hypothetical protein